MPLSIPTDGYKDINLLDPEIYVSPYPSNNRQREAMRRLSAQITEATLAAMIKAEVQSPGKPMLDVPLLSCPHCDNDESYYSKMIYDDFYPLNSCTDKQQCRRSNSVAIGNAERIPICRCSTPHFCSPLKNEVLLPPSIETAGIRNTNYSLNVKDLSDRFYKSELPCSNNFGNHPLQLNQTGCVFGRRRFSSSVNNLPSTNSQHTQTVFSSIANNDTGIIKPRSRLTSGSLYSKYHGLRMQLSSINKSKSFRKPGLDLGLRKTLSVTNAIVRMPIESATAPLKILSRNDFEVENRLPLSSSLHSSYTAKKESKLLRKLSNISEPGSLKSLPTDPTSLLKETKEKIKDDKIYQHSPEILHEKKYMHSVISNSRRLLSKSEEQLQIKNGKRNVQLQTTEDFEKEFKSTFNLPRILRTEDQDKKPEDTIEDQGLDELNKYSAAEKWKEQFMTFFQPSDNKLAKKLFGTKMALNKERSRQRKQGKFIIHPCSNFRFYWDLMMLVLLIANLIILPVLISFFIEDLGFPTICFNCISDTIFLLDIFVNFRTGILANKFADEIILHPKKIARHYIRTWFFLDFLSSIPLDYIFLLLSDEQTRSHLISAGRALRILRLVKLLSLLRLLRITRLLRYVSQWEEFLNIANKFMGIFNLVLLMLLLGHWNACLQFLIPMLNDYPVDSWVIKCKLKNAYWFEQYTWALFKAMSHMLSIGYGRFPPTSSSEAWITIISMMTGSTCYALFVGHAAALIQSFDYSEKLYREKLKQVEEYMAYRKLPRILRQRIGNYYEHRYQGKMFTEVGILDELSECLREQIVNHNCRALVAAVPFFTFADQHFVSEVIMKLKYEVFQPGDWIIKEGLLGTKMYFIQEGIVDIVNTDGHVATSLSDGSYFGEICLLTNARRVASVRAETYCNLYALDRGSFQEVLQNHPFMRRTLESVAAERLSQLGRDPLQVIHRKNIKEDLEIVKEIVNLAEQNGSEGGGSVEASDSETATGPSSTSFSKWASGKTRIYRRNRATSRGEQNQEERVEELEREEGRSSMRRYSFMRCPRRSSSIIKRRHSTHTALKFSIIKARKRSRNFIIDHLGFVPSN